MLRNQIHAELDARLPGLAAAVGDIFDHEPALVVARHLGSPAEIRARGLEGLARRCCTPSTSATIAGAWRRSWPGPSAPPSPRNAGKFIGESSPTWMTSVAPGCGRSGAWRPSWPACWLQTPYVLLLSFPGINVISAAEFAGEMGPIANTPGDAAITGRAGLFPSRYQSDAVDHAGPLVRRGNRALRYAILLIAENLLRCNDHFRGLGEAWRAAGRQPAGRGGPGGQAVLPDRLPDGGRPGRSIATRAAASGIASSKS